jgi:mannosyltransferase OCH1-like enzyme
MQVSKLAAFIKERYPWFLPIFDSYPYNIQRADVIRYFALAYYGGTYLDLDLVKSLYFACWKELTFVQEMSSTVRFIANI